MQERDVTGLTDHRLIDSAAGIGLSQQERTFFDGDRVCQQLLTRSTGISLQLYEKLPHHATRVIARRMNPYLCFFQAVLEPCHSDRDKMAMDSHNRILHHGLDWVSQLTLKHPHSFLAFSSAY